MLSSLVQPGRSLLLDPGPFALLAILAGAVALGLGGRGLALLLGRGRGLLAVARVTIVEIQRRRGAFIAAGVLNSSIAVLPLVLAGERRVVYQVQNILTYSLGLTSLFLTVLVALLACVTLASEVDDRSIQLGAVKPIGRSRYLLGKGIGLALALGWMLMVVGATTAGAAHVPLGGATPEERAAALTEVFETRRVLRPEQPDWIEPAVERELAVIEASDPALVELLTLSGLRKDLLREALGTWYALPPGRAKTFSFQVPDATGSRASSARLRWRVRARRSDTAIPLVITLDADQPQRHLTPIGESRELEVPAALLEDGRLDVVISNPGEMADESPSPTVALTGGSGLELLLPAGGFLPNLARAQALLGLRLLVVIVLGLCCSTFLGFPVATLAVLLISLAALASPTIVEDDWLRRASLQGERQRYVAERPSPARPHDGQEQAGHAHDDHGHDGHGVGHGHGRRPAPWFERGLLVLERAGLELARVGATIARIGGREEVVGGRWIDPLRVLRVAGLVLLSGGAALLGCGLVIFRRRELARVQV